MAATGTKSSDWFLPDDNDKTWRAARVVRKILETYEYRDENGNLQFQVVRCDPKGFFQRRPGPGGFGWVYQLGECWVKKTEDGQLATVDREGCSPDGAERMAAARNVPYLLAGLRKNQDQPVMIVEGERKADLLASLGFTATCAAKGAGKWPVEFGGFLAGRDVVVLSDNDAVGELHAAQVAGSCLLYGCKSIRMVKAGEGAFKVKEGGDIYDFCMGVGRQEDGDALLRTNRRSAVIELVKSFPKMERASPVGG